MPRQGRQIDRHNGVRAAAGSRSEPPVGYVMNKSPGRGERFLGPPPFRAARPRLFLSSVKSPGCARSYLSFGLSGQRLS
jgi:hypothetical protein